MRDFNDYKKPERAETKSGKTEMNADAMDLLYNLSSKYEGKGTDAIMRDILSEAEKGRKNGTLSDEDIDAFKNAIEPMLDQKQKKALDAIVKRLKKN